MKDTLPPMGTPRKYPKAAITAALDRLEYGFLTSGRKLWRGAIRAEALRIGCTTGNILYHLKRGKDARNLTP